MKAKKVSSLSLFQKNSTPNSDISLFPYPLLHPPEKNASRYPHAGRGEGLPRPAPRAAAAQEGGPGPSAEDGQDAPFFGDRSSSARRRPDRRRTRRAGQCEHRENHRHGPPRRADRSAQGVRGECCWGSGGLGGERAERKS